MAFVDLQNDVTVKDVAIAEQEGFHSVEHLKRYTTLGMATDQGKIGGVIGLAILSERLKRQISEVGTTTYRPPYTPVALGALAGRHRGKDFRPTRLPPSHQWALEQGAVMIETGAWLRAQYYPHAGETDWLDTVSREVRTVRSAVGVCDVSTLGRIDVQGNDAGIFLDRIYTNAFSSLPIGKARYGLMLREDGFVMDDGTTSRLAANHYFMTTTTANAAKVMQHLEFCHQVLWPDLDVQMVSVSEQWAQFSIAGPCSRDTLRNLIDVQYDLSNEAFPHLAAQPVTILGGLNALLFRLSFSGELEVRRQLRYIFPKERSSIFVPPAGAAMDRPASAIWRRSNPTSTTVTLVRMLLAKLMASRSNMMPGGRKGRGLRYRDSRERPNELAGHRHHSR